MPQSEYAPPGRTQTTTVVRYVTETVPVGRLCHNGLIDFVSFLLMLLLLIHWGLSYQKLVVFKFV